LQRESESEDNISWNEIGEVLDSEMSTVEDIRADLARNDKGNSCQTINNCMLVFHRDPLLKGSIRKNELSGKIDIVGNLGWQRTSSSLTDTDVYQIHWYLEKNYGLKNDRNINKAMNIVASENRYHPIRDYLEKLKWDGQPRIDNLLPRYLGADCDDYTKEIMRLFMLAAIHRVYEPGCKFEIMVCLVGGQGAGKSTFFRFLAINDEWFSDDLKRMDDDNVYRKMQGHWIIEMSEMMATVNAKSIEDIKSFISRQKETYKIPYETHPEDRPRQCVFVGTSNNMDFLPLDRTGNRRFAPVLVHPEWVEKHILEDEKESREYIRQAWAEAMELYRNGFHELKLSGKTEEYLKEMQKDFMPEDAKVGIIQNWLDELAEDYVCSIMIYKEAFSHEYDTPKDWELKEINNVMNHSIVGWEKISSHRFAGYGTQRGWRRVAGKNEFQNLPEDVVIPFEER
jgi:predicted P-loop ATPase